MKIVAGYQTKQKLESKSGTVVNVGVTIWPSKWVRRLIAVDAVAAGDCVWLEEVEAAERVRGFENENQWTRYVGFWWGNKTQSFVEGQSGMCKKWHVLHMIKLKQQVLINGTLRCSLPNTITTLYFIFAVIYVVQFRVQLKS